MTILSLLGGAAQAFNEDKDKQSEELRKAKEAAEKRAAELEDYRKKKEIDQEFKAEGKGLTKEQLAAFEAEKGEDFKALGYGVFGKPTGNDLYTVEFKKLEKQEGAGKLFESMDAAQPHIANIKATAEKYGYTPEIDVNQTDKGIEVKAKFKGAGEGGAKVVGTEEQAEALRVQMQESIDKDPSRKGKFTTKVERGKEGYTVSTVQDPAYKAEGAAGPGVSPSGMKYSLDFLPLQSNRFNSMEEYKSRSGKFQFVPLVNENIPRWGEAQEKYAGGYNKQWTIIPTGGIGDSADAQLQDLATQINMHMKPEFVKQLSDIAQKGGPVGGIEAAASAIQNVINLHDEATKAIVGDNLLRVPVEVKHAWLKDYIGIDPKIDAVLKGGLRKRAFEGTRLDKVLPINEPAYEDVTDDGQRVYKTPINPNLADAFAPEVETQPGITVRKYPDSFTNLTHKIATGSGMTQGKFHSVLNSAGSPQKVMEAVKRHDVARTALKNEPAFIEVDNQGIASYAIPVLGTRERTKVMAAVNSVEGHDNRILMMQSLISSKDALDNVTAVAKNTTAQGRFTAVTGKDAKSFRDLSEQLDTATDITLNLNEMEALLLEGAPVGAPLQLTRLEQGAKYMLGYLSGTLKTYDGAETSASKIIDGLQKKLDTASLDPDARRSALVNLIGTMLSYQLARMMDPNGRLSDEDRRTVQSAVGFEGIFANDQSALAVIKNMRDRADYIVSRNTSLTSGTVENQLAAHAYDKYSRGGSFKSMFAQIMPVSYGYTPDKTGGGGNPMFDDFDVAPSTTQNNAATPATPSVPSMTSGTAL